MANDPVNPNNPQQGDQQNKKPQQQEPGQHGGQQNQQQKNQPGRQQSQDPGKRPGERQDPAIDRDEEDEPNPRNPGDDNMTRK